MFNPVDGLINAVVGIIELLLSLRLIFKFFVIGTASSFVSWLFSFTQPIVSLIVIGLIGYLIA